MRQTKTYPAEEFPGLISKLIEYARKFDLACILDSHSEIKELSSVYDEYIWIAGFSNIKSDTSLIINYDQLKNLAHSKNVWYLGYLSYDLKNKFEDLYSALPDQMQWPELMLFNPDLLITNKDNKIIVNFNTCVFPDFSLTDIFDLKENELSTAPDIEFMPKISKAEYLERVEKIKKHIFRGDIYEVNYCQEFYCHCNIDAFDVYRAMSVASPSPFGTFLKFKDKYLISASPERFLKKTGEKIISQPIKGTHKRSEDILQDKLLIEKLRSDPKERSENIMIVDLVRNDLSKIAKKGTVHVDELCGIYTFPQVHQMISTISANINTSSLHEILKATFPMGSMTGAPKIEAMKIIEEYESVKRGLYSGSVGYITPEGNFDFNVVIRSLQYCAENNYVSYLAGSAITSLSDPEKEYEECIVKTYAMKEAFKPLINA